MQDFVIQTHQLTKYYGSRLALDHLNLRIPKGSIYGLLGRNGSGKTTAIKLMLGLLKPIAGQAIILGCDCQELTPRIREQIGYVTEGHRLYHWMTIGGLENYQRAFFPDKWNSPLFNEMIEYFELSKKQKIKSLSNGQRAQVSLAITMAPDPDILIMDDPTLGLDVVIRRQFLEGMIHLIQQKGKTILFSSHILSDVERVVDRIAVISDGVLRADCTLEEFRNSIRKVHLVLADASSRKFNLPGLLHEKRNENHAELTLAGTTDQEIVRAIENAGVVEYKLIEMNLEDQFIEFTAKDKKTTLFQWRA
jgi:ABC-2 type transport system ATP-binding protein